MCVYIFAWMLEEDENTLLQEKGGGQEQMGVDTKKKVRNILGTNNKTVIVYTRQLLCRSYRSCIYIVYCVCCMHV